MATAAFVKQVSVKVTSNYIEANTNILYLRLILQSQIVHASKVCSLKMKENEGNHPNIL